jgi:hypothetical protein
MTLLSLMTMIGISDNSSLSDRNLGHEHRNP